MDETVNTYLLSAPDTLVPMSRKEFYAEQVAEYEKHGKPTRAVEIINVLLFNTHGELLVQKRSFDKAHNPGQLDKSIGGHLKHGDTPDYTVMVETVQELQTPSIVLATEEDFQKTLILLKEYLTTVAIIRRAASQMAIFDKVIRGKTVQIANKFHLYIGVYAGRTRPVDRESKGILYYSLPELAQEMQAHPGAFTNDLHVILEKYRGEIDTFIETIQRPIA